MLLLNNGFTGGTPDRDRYLEVLAEYPESEEMDKLLEQMGLHV